MLKWVSITIILLGVLGFFGYQFAISKASDIMIDNVANQLIGDEDEFNKLLEDEALQDFIGNIDSSGDVKDLPFTTKEEAVTAVIKEFGIGELNNIASGVRTGEMSLDDVNSILEERLSEEEIEAIKIIAIKELQLRSE